MQTIPVLDPDFRVFDRELRYDPTSGYLWWKVRGSRRQLNRPAGSPNGSGYTKIGFHGKGYKAHRIAWLLTTGRWPEGQIDHLDGNRSNNRIENLREVSGSDNSRNARMRFDNTSGVSGVGWHKPSKKWFARVYVNRNQKWLGYFDDKDKAERVVKEFRAAHGFTERHGTEQA